MNLSGKKLIGFSLLGSIIGITLLSLTIYLQWGDSSYQVFFGPNATYQSLINDNDYFKEQLNIASQNISNYKNIINNMNNTIIENEKDLKIKDQIILNLQKVSLRFVELSGVINPKHGDNPKEIEITFSTSLGSPTYKITKTNDIFIYRVNIENYVSHTATMTYSKGWWIFISKVTYSESFELNSEYINAPQDFIMK